MTDGEKLMVKFLANIAERYDKVFRVRKALLTGAGKRGPRWLPGLMADLDGKPIRRGHTITAYQIDCDAVMHQYKLLLQGREIERKEKTDE